MIADVMLCWTWSSMASRSHPAQRAAPQSVKVWASYAHPRKPSTDCRLPGQRLPAVDDEGVGLCRSSVNTEWNTEGLPTGRLRRNTIEASPMTNSHRPDPTYRHNKASVWASS